MLVLVASLLGIVTNYATNENDAPWMLHVLQRAAIPAIGLLIVTMMVVQVVVYRLENPAPPPTAWPRDRVPYPALTPSPRTRLLSSSAAGPSPTN
ncbi:hypothetical protein ACIBUY_34040 [Streptomyces sp. NPDC050085]|uniref:hypothetical protein n=1 Tax=Streptomyces sp. NPDC050085 TaxID=3365600 RepID=UPI0037B4FD63